MKKILFVFILFFSFHGSQAQQTAPENVMNFIKKFQTAVMTHNYDSVMEYMDNEYVKVQYKKMLKKDIEQFIDEFFGGEEDIVAHTGFTNTRLADIKAIEIFRISNQQENEYEVIFRITRVSGNPHYCQCLLRKFRNKLGFFGAVG